VPTAYLVTGDEDTTAHPIVGDTIIGRDPACDLVLSDVTVSRRHASVRQDGNTVVISDLGSSNGTFVNGEPVADATRVEAGDSIRLGAAELRVRVESGEHEIATPTVTLPPAD
jgi:pSer/pThr/pTyr-binding forkhead associated (FHA) protein